MGTRLFVGNLSYNTNEQELREAFTGQGIEVRSVKVALDRETGRPRGFAFVETETEEGSKQAIGKLSGQVLQGRPLSIQEAQARPAPGAPRPDGGGFGGPRPGGGAGGFGGAPRPPFSGPRPPGAGGGGFGGSPRPAAPGMSADKAPAKARVDKKKSTRPKPQERERGNWHWNGKLDEDE